MMVENNNIIAIEYSLKNEEGQLLDTNEGFAPIEYLQGAGNIVTGLEKALLGLKKNDIIEVCLNPEEAYGQYKDELKYTFPVSQFEGITSTEPGNIIQLPDGNEAVILASNENNIVADANHPLAGKLLFYKIKIVAIRKAADAEINAGMPLPQYNDTYCGVAGCCC